MSGLGLPTGTVTFLFTDIESSTRRWEEQPAFMQDAFPRQEAILRGAIEADGGYAYKMVGDAFQAAFSTAEEALQAAIHAQLAFQAEQWSADPEAAEGAEIRVRMALHTGVTEERGHDYVGPALNRVARLLSSGHGGQVLISLATQQLLRDNLPIGVTLRDMGEHRLKDLTHPEHIFQMVHPDLPSEFPPLKTLDNRPNNLPFQATPLIGRVQEIAIVCEMMLSPDTRLLTLTGPGGIGKTRLALQAAAEMVDDFPDGVFFANLVPLADLNLVLPTIASVLGLRETAARSIAWTLKDYLKDKELLLLLDNFEQVSEAAPQVADLLNGAPHLKVLVTSRASLRLSMEHEYGVAPLSTPDPRHLPPLDMLFQFDAVRLFVQRAQAVKSAFEVNNQNSAAVAEICFRLEGIPLAVELTAARSKALPPQALLSKLGSRLKLLTGGARDLHSRQQTLRNTIDWSYDLLTGAEKQLFRRLAPFSGGGTLEAIEKVCNSAGDIDGTADSGTRAVNVAQPLEIDVLDGITSLLDKSLVYATDDLNGEPRYRMLETIQEYASERLEENGGGEVLQREHALYFMELAEKAESYLTGQGQAEWLSRLEEEHDNMRAALRWAEAVNARDAAGGYFVQSSGGHGGSRNPDYTPIAEQEAAQIAMRLAGAMWRFWYIRGYSSEGLKQLEAVLSSTPSLEEMKQLQELEQKGSVATDGTEWPGESRETQLRKRMATRAKALHGAGVLAYEQGNYSTASNSYQESLALKRELDDKRGVAGSLNNLGLVAYEQGDYSAALSL